MKEVVHAIKPGKRITPNRMVETYCKVLHIDLFKATLDKDDVTCSKCKNMMGHAQKNFAKNENLRKTQEG